MHSLAHLPEFAPGIPADRKIHPIPAQDKQRPEFWEQEPVKTASLTSELKHVGPPNEWSGGVAAGLGLARRKKLQEHWGALSAEEKRKVCAIFEKKFEKQADVPLLSKEKKLALKHVDTFFRQDDKAKKWDQFVDDVHRKAFVKALAADPRADEKLKQHAEMMNRLKTGTVVASHKGSTGNYDIVKLRGGGLGCTCPDWRYKRSVSPEGQRECKHLRALKVERQS
jgi:hypothetical protein